MFAQPIVFLDEYDELMLERPYYIQPKGTILSGPWVLAQKKVFCFTATSFKSLIELTKAAIGTPSLFSFKSEYELVTGKSPLQMSI